MHIMVELICIVLGKPQTRFEKRFDACKIFNSTNYLNWSLEIHVLQAKGEQKRYFSLQVKSRLSGMD